MKISGFKDLPDGTTEAKLELQRSEVEVLVNEGLVAVVRKGLQFEQVVAAAQKEISKLNDTIKELNKDTIPEKNINPIPPEETYDIWDTGTD